VSRVKPSRPKDRECWKVGIMDLKKESREDFILVL
jgi:hypothetical protein